MLVLSVVGGVSAQTATTYKSDFTDGEVISLTTTNVDDFATAGWITKNTTSTKSLNNGTGINPNTDKEEANAISGTFYQVKQQASRYLILNVTGVSKLTVYAYNGSSKSACTFKDDINGTTETATLDIPAKTTASKAIELTPTTKYSIKLWASGDLAIYAIKVDVPAADEPVLSFSTSKIDLDVLPSTADHKLTSTFSVTGSNLAAGTYNLNIPTIAGLTVDPTSFTVGADGTVSQDFTVTYAPTENADEANAEISTTVGSLTKTITVNYSAIVKEVEQRTISEATTWDFSKAGISSLAKVTDALLYANLGVKNSADFAADALTYVGSYPLEAGQDCRINTTDVLTFKTSVSGTVEATFSDTGSNGGRSIVVNGTQSTNSTPKNSKTQLTAKFEVKAGDVTIGGTSSIKCYKIVFTPSAATAESATITSAGWATYVTKGDVEFTGTDVEAYAAKYADDKITLTKVNAAPAGSALVIKGNEGTYELSAAATTPASLDNDLQAATADVTADGSQYILAQLSDGAVGFAQAEPKSTIAAGKAYLVITATTTTQAKSFYAIGGNETTGINNIAVEKAALSEDAPMYNLAGQKVTKAYKGVVIQNGKKFLLNK